MTERTADAPLMEPAQRHEPATPGLAATGHPPGGRRRRAFIAAPAPQGDSTPPAAPTVSEDEDLPVLTEVVSLEAAVSENKAEHLDEAQISLLASVITHAVEQQLATDLPLLLETALREAKENLRTGIAASLETALNEVLARYK